MRNNVPQADSVKDHARQIVEELPESCTGEDLMCRIYVQQAMDAGLADSKQGHTTSVEAVPAGFGPPR